MSDMNVNQVLAQMRAMSLEAAAIQFRRAVETMIFAFLLKKSIDSVNDTPQAAGENGSCVETGDTNVSLAEVMIASQKASVSFQAMLQVRNKLG